MPRKANQRGRDPIERIPFKLITFLQVTSLTLASPTMQAVNVVPSLDSRLNAIAAVYQWYRFIKLKVHLLPTLAANDVLATVGYLPRQPNTTPVSHNELCQMPASTTKSWSQQVKSTMIINQDIMIGDTNLKWYQTELGTEDTQFEIQGVLYFAGTANVNPSNTIVIIEGTCEFKGRANTLQSPLMVSPSPKLLSNVPLDEKKNEESDAVVISGVTYYRSRA